MACFSWPTMYLFIKMLFIRKGLSLIGCRSGKDLDWWRREWRKERNWRPIRQCRNSDWCWYEKEYKWVHWRSKRRRIGNAKSDPNRFPRYYPIWLKVTCSRPQIRSAVFIYFLSKSFFGWGRRRRAKRCDWIKIRFVVALGYFSLYLIAFCCYWWFYLNDRKLLQ